MAHTVATMLGSASGPKHELNDFVLRWGSNQRRRQTAEEQLNIFRALASRAPKD